MSQAVDTVATRELLIEALGKISEGELSALVDGLGKKSRYFQGVLSRTRLDLLDDDSLKTILRGIFATRRKSATILEQYPATALRSRIHDLLHGTAPVEDRFEKFTDGISGIDESLRRDFASELLHFTRPDDFWLWTRWMWDPVTSTGSLPLVLEKDFGLRRDRVGQTYLRVGEAVAILRDVGGAAAFKSIGRSPFGTDIFLACVYGVYVYSVLRMRMTQEFNKVVPQMPELVARLLGIHGREWQSQAESLIGPGGEAVWA